MSRRDRRTARELRELRRATSRRGRATAPQRPQTRGMSADGASTVVRRRRAVALTGTVVVVVALAGAAIALSSGSGRPAPRYLGAVGAARTLTPTAPTGAALVDQRAPTFHPPAAVTRLAAALTLPQQVAQLFLVSVDGTGLGAATELGSAPWGGVIFGSANVVSAVQARSLAADVVATGRDAGPIAPLLAAAQAGGPGTAFPTLPPESEAAIGASGSSALAESQALAAGKALKALGFAMTISPYVDVDIPDGALTGRLFSADPSTVARLALAALRGYAAAGIIAAPAHFPGEGGASADPDEMTATVGGSLAALRSRDLIPFAAIVRHAPVIVMSNAEYTAFDGVTPAALLPAAVDLLRDGYGFGGVVMSDDLDATLDATAQSPGQVAVRALDAGDDLLYITGPPSEHLQAYDGVLDAAEHSARVRRLVYAALLRDLTLKSRAGLLPAAGSD